MTDKVYGDYISEKNNWSFINHAIPGANNDRIFRSTLRNMQSLIKNNNPEDVCCVLNVTNAYRGNIWLDWENIQKIDKFAEESTRFYIKEVHKRYRESSDGDYVSWNRGATQMASIVDFFKGFHKYGLLLESSDEKMLYDAFCNILLITSYFKQHNIKYLIFFANLLDNVQDLINGVSWLQDLYKDIKSDSAIMNMTSDEVFTEWAIKNNLGAFDKHLYKNDAPIALHPDTHAHKLWADVLLTKLKNLYAI